jgi:hypothetical protein
MAFHRVGWLLGEIYLLGSLITTGFCRILWSLVFLIELYSLFYENRICECLDRFSLAQYLRPSYGGPVET